MGSRRAPSVSRPARHASCREWKIRILAEDQRAAWRFPDAALRQRRVERMHRGPRPESARAMVEVASRGLASLAALGAREPKWLPGAAGNTRAYADGRPPARRRRPPTGSFVRRIAYGQRGTARYAARRRRGTSQWTDPGARHISGTRRSAQISNLRHLRGCPKRPFRSPRARRSNPKRAIIRKPQWRIVSPPEDAELLVETRHHRAKATSQAYGRLYI